MKFDYTKQPGLKLWNRPLVTDGKPLVSIITPFYNAGEYFEQTYNCVMNQTFPWFEWIIVDDGTDDAASLQILTRLVKQDKRIKLFHQKNAGPSAARNRGIVESSTEYIYFLDADDLEEPTALEYHYWALRNNPDADWSFAAGTGFQEKEYLWDVPYNPNTLRESNTLNMTALVRKKAATAVGCFTVKGEPFDEDWHFWLKLIANGSYPVQMTREYLYWYRILKSGRMSSIHSDQEKLKRNQEIIEEQAAFIINPKEPITYPAVHTKQFEGLKTSDWKESIYREHKKIHVLFIFPWLMMGGADKFNLDLIKGLDRNRYEISIITTQLSENEWIQLFREEIPEIFNLPNFLAPEHYAEFVDYFIRSRKIDLIFQSNSTEGYYLLPWIRVNHPEVAIVDYVHMEEWYWRNGGHARTSGALGRITERTYVCNSATREVMLDKFHCAPERVSTVHIGIDEKFFDASRIREGMLYEELEIDKDRPIVLFICRLHPQKRPFLMLRVAEYVRKSIPEVAFVVIGDGDTKEELINKANAWGLSDTVYFLEARDEVRPYYKDAKLTLICSIKEGLALTAYESCAMGVPVVSADVGGQKDLIDNTVGRLIPLMQNEEEDFNSREFPKEEIRNYGEAIIEILLNEVYRQELSQNCRRKVIDGFTIHSMVQFFDEELERIVKDEVLATERKHVSSMLQGLGMFAEEAFLLHLASSLPDARNETRAGHVYVRSGSCANSPEMMSRLSACEEILNRHEEVANRHEKSINHQWEVQKWHEERLQVVERYNLLGRAMGKLRRLFRLNR